MNFKIYTLLIILSLFASFKITAKEAITFEDILKFEDLNSASITSNGNWITYRLDKQRGNNRFIIQSLNSEKKYEIENGIYAEFSNDTEWFAVKTEIDVLKKLNPDKYKNEKPDLELINTKKEYRTTIENISGFNIAKNGKWLCYTTDYENKDKEKLKGKKLVLRHLETETEIPVENVIEYELDSLGNTIYYSIISNDNINILYKRELDKDFAPQNAVEKDSNTKYTNLLWDETAKSLYYLSGKIIKDDLTKSNNLKLFNPQENKVSILADSSSRTGWYIPENNELSLTDDDKRLWFGYKPLGDWQSDDKDTTEITKENLYNLEEILEDTELYIWHPKDPKIIPQQVTEWSKTKSELYYSIYDLEKKNIIHLADSTDEGIIKSNNPYYTLQYDSKPYKKLITYSGWYLDLYSVNLRNGNKKLIAEKIEERPQLSPNGRYTVYFKEKNWYSYDNESGKQINLNSKLEIPFHDYEDDHPKEPPPYGFRGWIGKDEKILIADKYDIWSFDLSDGTSKLLSDGYGRRNETRIYPVNLDIDKDWFEQNEKILAVFTGEKTKEKHLGLFDFGSGIIDIKTKGEFQYLPIAKAEYKNDIILSKEGFDTYPDIWLSNLELSKFEKKTNLQSQVEKYKWGTSHLVEFVTDFGDTLQGYYALPDGYQKGKKYPVFVYFYEKFSNRKNQFNMPKVNHRPPYSLYLGSDYVMFFPDVKFYTGLPGKSSEKALIAGCNKLVEMGIADPEKIVIHGHSWSGYESAYIVTQTDYFAACVSGAPVSNMTSAYSGIRLGSGLARQFQYEKEQSRIGGNIIDSLDSYIRNSPIFFADKMNTPLLIMFGDADEAVPWQQGIELYLAMRRFDKNCIFLQYKDEPHHLKKIHNQLDYSMRMKQFMDYYVFGGEMPKWMLDGFRYKGVYNTGR